MVKTILYNEIDITNKTFKRICDYLIKESLLDDTLANVIISQKKSFKKCYEFIYNKARAYQNEERCACIDDEIVYSWAKEFYLKDDNTCKKIINEVRETDLQDEEPYKPVVKKDFPKEQVEQLTLFNYNDFN